MSDNTAIEWSDSTWNPVTGCTKVSPGCDNCYAETFAERWRGTPGHHFENGFDLTVRPERITQPLRWTKPRRIFVNSMSDLFHDQIGAGFIAEVFAVMSLAEQHVFQLLTKRHGRMRWLLNEPDFRVLVDDFRKAHRPGCGDFVWPIPNVWVGISAENQQWASIRIPALLETPAAVRWVSAEPLLGPITLAKHWIGADVFQPDQQGLDWIVVGGESGSGARPMQQGWAVALELQCRDAALPFFFKQAGTSLAKAWGCTDRKGGDPAEWPTEFPREYPAVTR